MSVTRSLVRGTANDDQQRHQPDGDLPVADLPDNHQQDLPRGGAEIAAPHVNEVRSPKLPPFWRADPELWFVSVEAQFFSCRITADLTKYFTIVAALDTPVLQQVSDVLRHPAERGKYDALKRQLIERFSDSREKQLHRLLTELELDDKKPSQLLREMLSLAGNDIPDDVLRTLWMKRMPINVRCVLSASDGVELNGLAQITDKIMEAAASPHVMAVEAIATQGAPSHKSLPDRISELERAVAELTALVKQQLVVPDEANAKKSNRHVPDVARVQRVNRRSWTSVIIIDILDRTQKNPLHRARLKLQQLRKTRGVTGTRAGQRWRTPKVPAAHLR